MKRGKVQSESWSFKTGDAHAGPDGSILSRSKYYPLSHKVANGWFEWAYVQGEDYVLVLKMEIIELLIFG